MSFKEVFIFTLNIGYGGIFDAPCTINCMLKTLTGNKNVGIKEFHVEYFSIFWWH